MLGMHHKTIRKFINEGKLRDNKVGKQWRISSLDLSLFMEDNDVSVKSKSESDVLDIISACISNDIKLLILREGTLTEEFMNLRTGLAGLVLQKFINYHIKASAVIESELEGRFKELVYELNKGNNFRVFNNNIDAENWILSKRRIRRILTYINRF